MQPRIKTQEHLPLLLGLKKLVISTCPYPQVVGKIEMKIYGRNTANENQFAAPGDSETA